MSGWFLNDLISEGYVDFYELGATELKQQKKENRNQQLLWENVITTKQTKNLHMKIFLLKYIFSAPKLRAVNKFWRVKIHWTFTCLVSSATRKLCVLEEETQLTEATKKKTTKIHTAGAALNNP